MQRKNELYYIQIEIQNKKDNFSAKMRERKRQR